MATMTDDRNEPTMTETTNYETDTLTVRAIDVHRDMLRYGYFFGIVIAGSECPILECYLTDHRVTIVAVVNGDAVANHYNRGCSVVVTLADRIDND